jgi:hypothetical protein
MNDLKISENLDTNIEYIKIYKHIQYDYEKDLKMTTRKPITKKYTKQTQKDEIDFIIDRINKYKEHIVLLKNKNKQLNVNNSNEKNKRGRPKKTNEEKKERRKNYMREYRKYLKENKNENNKTRNINALISKHTTILENLKNELGTIQNNEVDECA